MKKTTILMVLIILMFSFGITYSIFYSRATLEKNNQGIAKFIFESQDLDSIDLKLVDLKPGDKKEYLFSVTNKDDQGISEVTVEYDLIIKTYHFMPLVINLYKVNENGEDLLYGCDESASRTDKNELICNAPTPQVLSHKSDKLDNYRLEILFPKAYNDVSYAGLIDFINLEISSWQKI